VSKLELRDLGTDIVLKMSEGNPGAMSCVMDILGKEKVHLILILDTLGLYGSNLYMLWSDCCSRDLGELERVLGEYRAGKITKEQIFEHISGGYQVS